MPLGTKIYAQEDNYVSDSFEPPSNTVPKGFGGGLVLINESENRRKERQALPSDKDGPGYVPHDDFQQTPTNFLTLEQLVDSELQFLKPFSFRRKPSFPSEAQPQEIKGSLWFTEMAPGTG